MTATGRVRVTDPELELLAGCGEDLELAVGRLRRASRRLQQLVEVSGSEVYGELADVVAGDVLRLEVVASSVRGRVSVLRAR